MLSCDPKSTANVISQTLVTDVLGANIYPFDKETTPQGDDSMNYQDANGYVDLRWCFERNRRRLFNTRFIVTSSQNALYDAVLGKEDAKHYGMLGTRN